MSELKIATFNIEWMVSIFNGRWTDWDGTIPDTFAGRRLGSIELDPIEDVPELCNRIAGVVSDIGAKILVIQEGPPRKDQMEFFVAEYLDDDYEVHTSNSRWQTLHALVHRSISSKVTSFTYNGDETLGLRRKVSFYPWGEIATPKKHGFYRTPLVLTFRQNASTRLRIINVHTKSKYSKLKEPEQWENREKEAIDDALLARQKLSAEIAGLRAWISADLNSDSAPDGLIVLGDMNDGAYAELIEREFLIKNIIDELTGSFLDPDQYLKHAMTPSRIAESSTCSFPDPFEDGNLVEELIDHVLVSRSIWQDRTPFKVKSGSCRVEKQAYNSFHDDDGPARQRHLRPSDHKPVSVVIQY